MSLAVVTSFLGPILARIFLPFVLLALGVANAPALRSAEDLNIKLVCSKCGHVESCGSGRQVNRSARSYGSPGDVEGEQEPRKNDRVAMNGNGWTTKPSYPPTTATKMMPEIPEAKQEVEVQAPISPEMKTPAAAITRDLKPKPTNPAASTPVVEPESDVETDRLLTEEEESDGIPDIDDVDEPEDTAVTKDVAYSKPGEGENLNGYNIASEMSVNFDDPKVQEEMRNAVKLDPLMKKELLEENADQADKIREILGADGEDTDGDADDYSSGDEVEVEVEEDDVDAESAAADAGAQAQTSEFKPKKKLVMRKIPKVKFLIASKAARMTVKKRIVQIKTDAVALQRTSQPSKERQLTTMTSAEGKGRFSMIMAVSQGYLNSQLMFRHAMTPAMHNIAVKATHGAELNATLKAPQISLHFDDGTASTAVYHMAFGAGHCKLWNGTTLVECDTSGWKYAFSVNLALQNMEPTCTEAQEVAKNWGKPGDYSIRQLLIDLKTADLTTDFPEYTQMGSIKHTKKTLASFKCLVMAWMQQADESGGTVIGHSLTADTPSTAAGVVSKKDKTGQHVEGTETASVATIPTSQMLQTYPYIPKGEMDAEEGLGGDADSNMLIFLNMTQGRDFPSSKALAYSGNWCTPQIPGTLCIARQVLFDDFLLPLLAEVNRCTHLEPTKCVARFANTKSRVEFDIGKGSPRPAAWYQFTETPNPAHKADWPRWTWTSSASRQHNHKGRLKAWYCRGSIATAVANTVTPLPGTNRIVVDTTSSVRLVTKVTGVFKRAGTVDVVRKGKFEIRVRSVADGNVELVIDGLEPGKSPLKFTVSAKSSKQGLAILSKGLFEHMKKDMAQEVTDSAELKKMAAQIQESIGTVGTFVVPGGGHFFIEGACFNNARDLMFEAEYKAAN